MLALFRAQARTFPLNIGEMERHTLGSQTFIPLGTQRFVLVVAAASAPAMRMHCKPLSPTDGKV